MKSKFAASAPVKCLRVTNVQRGQAISHGRAGRQREVSRSKGQWQLEFIQNSNVG